MHRANQLSHSQLQRAARLAVSWPGPRPGRAGACCTWVCLSGPACNTSGEMHASEASSSHADVGSLGLRCLCAPRRMAYGGCGVLWARRAPGARARGRGAIGRSAIAAGTYIKTNSELRT